jgi:uncharacterized protein YjbI with pentapeptide repeats
MKITNRFTGAVLFELECDSLRVCVEAAINNGANLRGANLDGANLRGANLDGASLYGASLDGANLDDASLYGANLDGANLDDASLGGANLGGANLGGANLYGANLGGANLDGANLGGANLGGAILGDANLGDANLYGHKVDGTVGIIQAGMPNNWLAFGYVDRVTQQLHVRVGCRNKEIGEGRAYWSSPDHPALEKRREVLAALDYIEAVARLRGWGS